MKPRTEYYYKEELLWANHLKFLWESDQFKQYFIKNIDYHIYKIYQCLCCTQRNLNLRNDILKQCMDELKEKKNSITLYWLKYTQINIFDIEERQDLLEKVLEIKDDDITSNDDIDSRHILVNNLCEVLSRSYECHQFLYNLLYHLVNINKHTLDNIDQEEMFGLKSPEFKEHVKAFCLKELWDIKQAQDIIAKSPDFVGICSNKAVLASILIIQGKEKEGLKCANSIQFEELIEEAKFQSYLQLGRALFDVGSFKLSKKYKS